MMPVVIHVAVDELELEQVSRKITALKWGMSERRAD